MGRDVAAPGQEEPELSYTRIAEMSPDEAAAIVARGPEEIVRLIETAAKQGIVDAQMYWAQMLLDGYGGRPSDPQAAFRWFSIAAGSGRPHAVNMLGRCHELGWGVPVDHAEAALLYDRGAQGGDSWAQFNLACLKLQGQGVPRDAVSALTLYVSAARQGHGKAMTMIGRFREEGWAGVRPDLKKALGWYDRGVARADFRAHWQVARLAFAAGDRKRALCHLEQAIDHASPPFCRDVADALLADADAKVAAFGRRAMERAATNCAPEDLERLAVAFEEGLGGPVDIEAASKLRRKAAAPPPAPVRRGPRRRRTLIQRFVRVLGWR